MANQSKPSPSDDNSSRNYLTVTVSLFVLVCLFVGIAATSPTFETRQRWILIGFVITFAIAGLGLSIWMVSRQSRQRSSGDSRELGWKTSPTDRQRRKLNDNLREIIVALNAGDVQIDDLFSVYIVAEDLAFRQIQQEMKENLLRQQSVGGIDFDAILFKPDFVTCIETAFLFAPDVPQAKIDEILSRISSAKKFCEQSGKKANLRLLFVLITQLDKTGEAQLRSSLVKKFSATSVDVDIRLFDFEDLQKKYAP